jgi:uncharacterized membrane protein
MEEDKGNTLELQIGKILLFILIIGIGVPLTTGILFGIDYPQVLSFIFSTALFQAASSPLGLLLGFEPWLVLFLMSSFALGMILAIWEICETFALTSERISSWIDKVEQKTKGHPFIYKYGYFSCIFIAWIPGIGLYGTPVIAWILRWNRIPSAIFTLIGFFLASLFMMVLASGISIILV